MAGQLTNLVTVNRLSSVHVNFMNSEDTEPFLEKSYMLRQTIQYR